MATTTARRRRAIEHLVATDFAHARLARAAFDAVVDGLDLGPVAVRSAADRAWVELAVAGPIQHAADRALGGLVDDLIESLSRGDPSLIARIIGHAADPDDLTSFRPERRIRRHPGTLGQRLAAEGRAAEAALGRAAGSALR